MFAFIKKSVGAAAVLSLAAVILPAPVHATTTPAVVPAVTGVSAIYDLKIGFMVSWTPSSDRKVL